MHTVLHGLRRPDASAGEEPEDEHEARQQEEDDHAQHQPGTGTGAAGRDGVFHLRYGLGPAVEGRLAIGCHGISVTRLGDAVARRGRNGRARGGHIGVWFMSHAPSYL